MSHPVRRARSAAAVAALVAVGAIAVACAAPVPVEFPDGDGSVVPVAAPDTAAPLTFRGTDLVDAHGRVVQLHGINMVRKAAPFHVSPDEARFDETVESIRRSGFNAVRLGVWMASLTPEPGVIDTAYLDEVQRGVDALAAEGVWVLLDFHQDIFTGMPEWATTPETAQLSPTLEGGEAFWALAYFAPRSMQQWEDLYARVPVADGRSAVDLMGDAVASVAERFEASPNVIGIDLMNEPWPGERFFDCLGGTCAPRYDELVSIYSEYTAKVRAVAPGMEVWWAPFNWGRPFQGTPTPAASGLEDVGVTFHSYCLYTDGGEPVQPGPVEYGLCRNVYEGQVAEGVGVAQHWDTPVLLGEFGASASPLNTTRLTQLGDEHQLSWMYWDDNYFRQTPEVVRTDLVRAYPQATAGDVTDQRFDPASGDLDLRYVPDHGVAAPTSIVAPTEVYPDGYTVLVDGGSVVSAPNAGRIEVVAEPGAAEVVVRVRRV